MSRVQRQQSPMIARALHSWCGHERISMMRPNTSYLDDFEKFKLQVRSEGDDFKAQSHISRTRQFAQAFLQHPEDPVSFARYFYNSLTFTDGQKRNYDFFCSKNQAEYYARRFPNTSANGPVGEEDLGFNLHDFVQGVVAGAPRSLNAAQMVDLTEEVIAEFMDSKEKLRAILGQSGDSEIYGNVEGPAAQLFKDNLYLWLGHATLQIVFYANQFDGDLTRVPFLQPCSITEQPQDNKLWYPMDPARAVSTLVLPAPTGLQVTTTST